MTGGAPGRRSKPRRPAASGLARPALASNWGEAPTVPLARPGERGDTPCQSGGPHPLPRHRGGDRGGGTACWATP